MVDGRRQKDAEGNYKTEDISAHINLINRRLGDEKAVPYLPQELQDLYIEEYYNHGSYSEARRPG